MDLPRLHAPDAKERLIAAAGEEFSRSGYRAASVRDICDAAGVNVSSVKYYFGSKKALYLAVWEIAAVHMAAHEPMPGLDDADSPATALREFIRWFMRLVLTQSVNHPWAGQLLAHETVEPTPGALEVFVERCAGPIRDEMSRIVSAIVGDAVTVDTLNNLVFAVIALCVNPKHSRAILTLLGHPPPESREGIDRMALVMADFALHGLIGFTEERDEC